jgi:hypothetical protein
VRFGPVRATNPAARFGQRQRRMTGAALTPTVAAMWLFGTFFFF